MLSLRVGSLGSLTCHSACAMTSAVLDNMCVIPDAGQDWTLTCGVMILRKGVLYQQCLVKSGPLLNFPLPNQKYFIFCGIYWNIPQ